MKEWAKLFAVGIASAAIYYHVIGPRVSEGLAKAKSATVKDG